MHKGNELVNVLLVSYCFPVYLCIMLVFAYELGELHHLAGLILSLRPFGVNLRQNKRHPLVMQNDVFGYSVFVLIRRGEHNQRVRSKIKNRRPFWVFIVPPFLIVHYPQPTLAGITYHILGKLFGRIRVAPFHYAYLVV